MLRFPIMTIQPISIRGLLVACALGCFAASATPQAKSPSKPVDVKNPNYGTIHLRTNLGSFKLLPKGALTPAEGRVDISFTGSVLLSGFEGTIEKSGNVRLEYRGVGREVYFGTGRMVLTGRFRGIQWFGRNMTCDWTGDGVARVYGEFDKNLFTGEYYYGDPTNKIPWGTYGMQAEVPEKVVFGTGTPVPRTKTGGKQGGN